MIAISYRREDSLPIAGRLYDRLQATFGRDNVFMDFDSIPPGVDFREQIKKTIERSTLVIALIGPHWLGERADGLRRIDDPADFVRLEIEYALERGISVIPLLINNTPMPDAQKLPVNIQGLAFRNALPLDSGLDFHPHADRLIRAISKTKETVESPSAEGPGQQPRPNILHRSKKIGALSVLLLLGGAAIATWLLGVRFNRETAATEQPVVVKPQGDATKTPTPTPTPAIRFSDRFDGTIDRSKWTTSGNTVTQHLGIMRVETTKQDAGGVLQSVPFVVQSSGEIRMTRKVNLHRGSYVYMATLRLYIGSLPPVGIHYCDINWSDTIGETTYVRRNAIHLSRNNANPHIAAYNADVSDPIPPIWDQWFDEEIRYDPSTGVLSYFVNGVKQMDYNVGALTEPNPVQMSMRLDSWGWFAGHAHWMNGLIVSQL
jgi:hypothetical protein